jgi:hypothetical protein
MFGLGAILGAVGKGISGAIAGAGGISGIAGSAARTIGSGLLTGAVGRFNRRQDYNMMRSQGFTHSEIAGSSAMGSDGGQAVMGNQYTAFEAQRREQEFQHGQRQLDREVNMRAQDMGLASAQTTAQATLGAASLNADASYNSARTNFDIAAMNNDRLWQEMANRWANDNPDLNMVYAQMAQGIENTQLQLILQRNNLTPSEIRGISMGEFNTRLTAAMDEMAALQGLNRIPREGARELLGTANDARRGVDPNAPFTGTIPLPPMPNLGNPGFTNGP